jgi:cellulose synthase/poly-beta-1,6-N-acetylglucosamine synthase-like glycosyltransferase
MSIRGHLARGRKGNPHVDGGRLELLGAFLEAVGLALCGYVGVLVLADVYLIVVHLHAGSRQLARELPPPSDDLSQAKPEPLVCVQLPVFNEPALIGAAIDSLCALDWPRDRLEIMILDDSTDETSDIAASRVVQWREKGFVIHHIVRAHRTAFKAGALSVGLQHTTAPYLAIFDADYRPPSSFLRNTMATLLADPRLAFVQARLDYRNRERNLLTRAQALELDTFLAYEQAARNWGGIPTTFNGTCGVWRRQAIEDAGGWSGRSLVEDQDLSFRVFALGWRCRNLVSVSVEGELPESFDVLAMQRQRWGTGTAQAFRDLPWRLLSELKWYQAIIFVLLALFYASTSVVLVTILAVAGACWLIEPMRAVVVGFGLLATIASIVVTKSIGAALATRILGRPLGISFVGDVGGMWLMEAALLPIVGKALFIGYLSRQVPFLRTPKKGR